MVLGGGFSHGIVFQTTVGVWTPIKDLILGSRTGLRLGSLRSGLNIWDLDIGLRWIKWYRSFKRCMVNGGWSGPQVKDWVLNWTSGSWNGGLDSCEVLDPDKVLDTAFEYRDSGWPSWPWHFVFGSGCRSELQMALWFLEGSFGPMREIWALGRSLDSGLSLWVKEWWSALLCRCGSK